MRNPVFVSILHLYNKKKKRNPHITLALHKISIFVWSKKQTHIEINHKHHLYTEEKKTKCNTLRNTSEAYNIVKKNGEKI